MIRVDRSGEFSVDSVMDAGRQRGFSVVSVMDVGRSGELSVERE